MGLPSGLLTALQTLQATMLKCGTHKPKFQERYAQLPVGTREKTTPGSQRWSAPKRASKGARVSHHASTSTRRDPAKILKCVTTPLRAKRAFGESCRGEVEVSGRCVLTAMAGFPLAHECPLKKFLELKKKEKSKSETTPHPRGALGNCNVSQRGGGSSTRLRVEFQPAQKNKSSQGAPITHDYRSRVTPLEQNHIVQKSRSLVVGM
jgi:hypothetical protein